MGTAEYHLRDGWKRLEVIRKNGIYAGKADIYIYSPDGNKFRSKKELLSYLTANNLPYKVEELFTATDASGSNVKVPEKTKKTSAPEKTQVSESTNSTPIKLRLRISDSANSASSNASTGNSQSAAAVASASQKTSTPAPSTQKTSAPAPSTQKTSTPAPSSQKTATSAPQSQKPAAATPPSPKASAPAPQSPKASAPAPSGQKTATSAPPSPGHGPGGHVMSTSQSGNFNILKERLRSAAGGSGKDASANASPFIQTPYGNPSFVPQKVGRSNAEARIPRPPKAPEKPLMPYMRYSRRVWEAVKAEHPDLKLWEIGKIIGRKWRDLPEEFKAEFVEEYEAEKLEYEKAMRIYYSSPAYLNYVQARHKAGLPTEENRDSSERQMPKTHERKIDIQPAEDDEDGQDIYTVKSLAYARYVRNHKLMSAIFSGMIVPEMRYVVTSVRLQILRRQVYSLKLHQRKLESELGDVEDGFQEKKRKIEQRNIEFMEQMKKLSQKAVDHETFEKMIQNQVEILIQESLNKTSGSDNKSESAPSAAAGAPPAESCESQVQENKEKESQEQAAGATAAASNAPLSMEIEVPASVISAASTDSMDNYSGVGYYPPAQQGHYPVQPVSVPVPSQPQYQYTDYYAGQQGYYTQYHPNSYGYYRYSPYPTAQYFIPEYTVVQQGYESGAPIEMGVTEQLTPGQQAPTDGLIECITLGEPSTGETSQPSGQ